MPIVGADFCREMLVRGPRRRPRRPARLAASASSRPTRRPCPSPTTRFNSSRRLRPAQRHRHRPRARRDGPRCATRRPCCDPGVLEAAALVLRPAVPLVLPLRAAAGRPVLSRNRESAYRYLPESVLEFPDYEALAAKLRSARPGRRAVLPFTFGIATLYVGVKPMPSASGA